MEELVQRISGPIDGEDPLVVELVREKHLQQPSHLPYNLSTVPMYQLRKRLDSWGYIHSFVSTLFEGYYGGVFVESGALDGEYLSNTLWLEQELSWTGLLVEPDPDSYRQLSFKHRKAWSSNTCLSRTTYPHESIHVGLRLNGDYIGNIWDYRGSSHLQGVTLEPIFDSFLSKSQESYHSVQCFPLVTYLRALNMTSVDLLVLDMQGVEKDVLRALFTTPLDIIIRVIVVEITSKRPDPDFDGVMTRAGYNCVNSDTQGLDRLYVRKNDPIYNKLKMYVSLDETTTSDTISPGGNY